ncbi:unnamed protein product [Prorocentrum cordatum]|uniref:Uncharacterized protein n=1 Tax=Prorocentrum cordatum TaxID=2364126 RepID=A0ABN9T4Q7_9DINO|nr:unnamed protein product [Polarella glacialis]
MAARHGGTIALEQNGVVPSSCARLRGPARRGSARGRLGLGLQLPRRRSAPYPGAERERAQKDLLDTTTPDASSPTCFRFGPEVPACLALHTKDASRNSSSW